MGCRTLLATVERHVVQYLSNANVYAEKLQPNERLANEELASAGRAMSEERHSADCYAHLHRESECALQSSQYELECLKEDCTILQTFAVDQSNAKTVAEASRDAMRNNEADAILQFREKIWIDCKLKCSLDE